MSAAPSPPGPVGFRITTDPGEVDLDAVHAFLSTSYWATGIRRELLARAIEGSIPFSVLADGGQVGFARVITDRATFAYLADVYVLEAHRGRGLSRRLVAALLDQPEMQGLRRLMLVTRDAHGLYEKFGFTSLAHPERVMERHRPDVYTSRG
jgi:GNAT superfamily N-acetyltransferase